MWRLQLIDGFQFADIRTTLPTPTGGVRAVEHGGRLVVVVRIRVARIELQYHTRGAPTSGRGRCVLTCVECFECFVETSDVLRQWGDAERPSVLSPPPPPHPWSSSSPSPIREAATSQAATGHTPATSASRPSSSPASSVRAMTQTPPLPPSDKSKPNPLLRPPRAHLLRLGRRRATVVRSDVRRSPSRCAATKPGSGVSGSCARNACTTTPSCSGPLRPLPARTQQSCRRPSSHSRSSSRPPESAAARPAICPPIASIGASKPVSPTPLLVRLVCFRFQLALGLIRSFLVPRARIWDSGSATQRFPFLI